MPDCPVHKSHVSLATCVYLFLEGFDVYAALNYLTEMYRNPICICQPISISHVLSSCTHARGDGLDHSCIRGKLLVVSTVCDITG